MNGAITHHDLAVILALSGTIQLSGLVALGVMTFRMGRMLAEAQRLTRAVAGLVVQEEEKTRALFRQSR